MALSAVSSRTGFVPSPTVLKALRSRLATCPTARIHARPLSGLGVGAGLRSRSRDSKPRSASSPSSPSCPFSSLGPSSEHRHAKIGTALSQHLSLSSTLFSPRQPLERAGNVGGKVPTPPPLARPFSSGSRLQWFWSKKPKKTGSCDPLQPDDLPVSTFVDDYGYSRVPRSTNELKIRCTEFDESGNVKLVNGEYKKTELIAKYSLLPRDLRKIDSSMLPHILIRPNSILINLLHLRVLIKHDRVLVFDAYGSRDSYTQSVFMYDLEAKLRSAATESRQPNSLPYEFRALEAVLISVTANLEGEFEGMREPIVRVLRELEEDIDRDKLRYLLVYSKRLGSFEQKARLVRDALDELLDADDDLAAMYLTEKAAHVRPARTETADHTEIELLLESYHKVTDEIVHAAENLVSNIRNTEELVKAILDANRNSIMLLDLKFSICTLGLGMGTFVAALYGMNLHNFMEESTVGFGAVSALCVVGTVGTVGYGLRVLRRIQRVRMWGDPHSRLGSGLVSIANLNMPMKKPIGGGNGGGGGVGGAGGAGLHPGAGGDVAGPPVDHSSVRGLARGSRWRRPWSAGGTASASAGAGAGAGPSGAHPHPALHPRPYGQPASAPGSGSGSGSNPTTPGDPEFLHGQVGSGLAPGSAPGAAASSLGSGSHFQSPTASGWEWLARRKKLKELRDRKAAAAAAAARSGPAASSSSTASTATSTTES